MNLLLSNFLVLGATSGGAYWSTNYFFLWHLRLFDHNYWTNSAIHLNLGRVFCKTDRNLNLDWLEWEKKQCFRNITWLAFQWCAPRWNPTSGVEMRAILNPPLTDFYNVTGTFQGKWEYIQWISRTDFRGFSCILRPQMTKNLEKSRNCAPFKQLNLGE